MIVTQLSKSPNMTAITAFLEVVSQIFLNIGQKIHLVILLSWKNKCKQKMAEHHDQRGRLLGVLKKI